MKISNTWKAVLKTICMMLGIGVAFTVPMFYFRNTQLMNIIITITALFVSFIMLYAVNACDYDDCA
jgi:hypothetical protein